MTSKLKVFFLFIFLLLGQAIAQANYPIYIMLTHPRATGTAFEKVMRTQEGMSVLHAPFLDPYLVKKYGTDHSFTKTLSNPSITFEDVKNHLLKLSEKSPVFLKESGYLLIDDFKEHPEFYLSPQVKLAILVRDPAKSVISFYRKMPTVTESIIGHKQLWDLFVMIKEKTGKELMVIDSDNFLKNPIPILNKLGKSWNLQFGEKNLTWEKGYSDDWRLKDWYVEVGNSTKLESYKGDIPRLEDGTPLYAEVADETVRQRLQEFYRSQNVFYQKLLQHALKP